MVEAVAIGNPAELGLAPAGLQFPRFSPFTLPGFSGSPSRRFSLSHRPAKKKFISKLQSDIFSSDSRMKWVKSGEHHFSTCQIMMRETSSGFECQFNRTRLFSDNSFWTETSGQTVYPIPLFTQPFRQLTLENLRILVLSCFCLSDRSNNLG